MLSESNSKPIDESVGGLVWVRRRNGSWWPGRIMGLHELSKNLSVSPRSGTPVKLLGREDASVDWYNLEKSRRVKAFRCGEYDECIEKAKATAAGSNKKAVKYARREDAILHALELENANEPDGHHGSQSRGSFGIKHELMDEKECIPEANPAKELSQSGISFEDPDHVSTSQIHSLPKKKRKTPNDSEDDGIEGTKRMRGLEDLGVGVLSKRKASMRLNSEGSHGSAQLDSSVPNERTVCISLSSGSSLIRSKGSCSSLKRRQTQVAIIHENLRRKDRRRPLTKVLESTAMVSVPVFCDHGPNPGQSSLQFVTDSKISAVESTDSKNTCVSVVLNNNSDCTGASCDKNVPFDASQLLRGAVYNIKAELSTVSELPENACSDGLFDVPFVGEAEGTLGFSPSIASRPLRKQCGEGLDESGSTNLTFDVNSVGQRTPKRTSKWQSKGKRNLRNPSQKRSKCVDWKRSFHKDASLDVSLVGKHRISGDFNRKLETNTSDESLASDNRVDWIGSDTSYMDSISYGRRSPLKREGIIQSVERKDAALDFISHEKSAVATEMFSRNGIVSPSLPQRSLPYRHSRFTPHPKYQNGEMPERSGFRGGCSLFDVNLEVRASHTGQHVPLVSLMSKLNGKAIVGHPVTVEAWEEGYCDLLMNSIDCCPTSSNGELYDVPTDNKSKQAMHVSGNSMLVNGCVKHADVHPRTPVKHVGVGSSPSPKKSPKTSRKLSLLSKKTRRLSSFTVAPKQAEEGCMKLVEKSEVPVVSCIPLKVVISRLNEAFNGSARPSSNNP